MGQNHVSDFSGRVAGSEANEFIPIGAKAHELSLIKPAPYPVVAAVALLSLVQWGCSDLFSAEFDSPKRAPRWISRCLRLSLQQASKLRSRIFAPIWL